jgi:hypothetical protein
MALMRLSDERYPTSAAAVLSQQGMPPMGGTAWTIRWPTSEMPVSPAGISQSHTFFDAAKNDPIAGMAHHLVAPCPVSDSHHVNGTPFESQKLVESATFHLRNLNWLSFAPNRFA